MNVFRDVEAYRTAAMQKRTGPKSATTAPTTVATGNVFQDAALFDSLTIYNNIALPLREGTSMAKTEIKKRVLDRLEQFELQAFTAPDEGGDDILACVKRVSDQKDFKIGLSLLEGTDFNDESFQFIDDYAAWYKKY